MSYALTATALLIGCGGRTSVDNTNDVPLDARGIGDGDVCSDGEIQNIPDASLAICSECWRPCDSTLCLESAVLTTGASLLMQDTGNGGFGDCAVSASGGGGLNLYYSFTLPDGCDIGIVTVTPKDPDDLILLRALSGCYASMSHAGGVIVEPTSLYLSQDDIVAVSTYHGNAAEFDISFSPMKEGPLAPIPCL